MDKTIALIIISGFLFGFLSCSQNNTASSSNPQPEDSIYSASEIQEAEDLIIPVTELRNMPEETKQKRAAAIILSDYVVLENNQYRLDISEQEALELGIKPHLYKELKKDIADTNAIIKAALEKGDTIELCDVRAVSKAYKNGEASPTDQ